MNVSTFLEYQVVDQLWVLKQVHANYVRTRLTRNS